MTRYRAQWSYLGREHAGGGWGTAGDWPHIDEAREALKVELRSDIRGAHPVRLAIAEARIDQLMPGVVLQVTPAQPEGGGVKPWLYRIIEVGGDDD